MAKVAKAEKPATKEEGKTRKATARKPRVKKQPTVKLETEKDYQKRIAELEEQLSESQNSYGKLLEAFTNNRIKLDVALGQFLKAFYVMGIGPEEIKTKCSQMFCKRQVAD